MHTATRRTYGEVGITPQNTPWYLRRVHRLGLRPRRSSETSRSGTTTTSSSTCKTTVAEFSRPPGKFDIDVQFDFDGPYSLAFPSSAMRACPSMLLGLAGRMEYTILHGFQDSELSDGAADLVTVSFAGRSPAAVGRSIPRSLRPPHTGRYVVSRRNPTPSAHRARQIRRRHGVGVRLADVPGFQQRRGDGHGARRRQHQPRRHGPGDGRQLDLDGTRSFTACETGSTRRGPTGPERCGRVSRLWTSGVRCSRPCSSATSTATVARTS